MIKDIRGNDIKLAVWIVVRDDKYYIDMAIKSVLPYVDGIYILDNGSTDGTIELIESFNSDKIFLEKVNYDFSRADFDVGHHTNTHPYWQWDETKDGNSLEAETRNICIAHCKERFNPDWLIQCDADEVYTPLFFKQLRKYDLKSILALRHSTDSFITRNMIMRRPDDNCFDPHNRSWTAHLPIKWEKTDSKLGHVAPTLKNCNGRIAWMSGIVHVHLHRTFGKKAEAWWGAKKVENELYDPRKVNLKFFKERLACSKKVNFNWSELGFVTEKWDKWGIWNEEF